MSIHEVLEKPDLSPILLAKYPNYHLLGLVDKLRPEYESFRFVYKHRLTGRVIETDWIDYKYYGNVEHINFGFFSFLWRRRIELKTKPENFDWKYLARNEYC